MKKLLKGQRNFIQYLHEKYPATTAVSHEDWDQLLKRHVGNKGEVDYRSFFTDLPLLNKYLQKLSDHPPNNNLWNKEKQLAYWINLYNASTVKLILDHYPVTSIQEIKKGIQIPFFNSIFDKRFIQVGELQLSLNDVEHAILRLYNEPRIHFTINCASGSCPILQNEAYTSLHLDEQMETSARNFLADETKNQLNKDTPELSKIFQWYLKDFGGNKGLREKIKQWSGTTISLEKVDYPSYDWNLNEKQQSDAEQTETKDQTE